jgi:hypothetical protein
MSARHTMTRLLRGFSPPSVARRAGLRVAFCRLAGSLLLVGTAEAADVETLLERMRATMLPPVRMQAAFTFEIQDDAGDTSRWAGRLERDGATGAIRMRFESPRDLKGVVFTAAQAREGTDTITIYLPSVRRTRTIQQNFRGVPFLGSDFNYEDLGLEQLQFQSHRIVGEGDVGGRPCDRVESRPTRSWWYGRIVRCIDREDFLPRHTEYVDVAGLPYKARTLEDVRVVDSHPTAMRTRMRVVPDESESTITLSDVAYGAAR